MIWASLDNRVDTVLDWPYWKEGAPILSRLSPARNTPWGAWNRADQRALTRARKEAHGQGRPPGQRIIPRLQYCVREFRRQDAGLRLLDHPHLYYLHLPELTNYLIGLLGSWQRASAVLEVLRLQVGCGAAYPTARYLSTRVRCSKRTWWRTMEWLRAAGLVRTEQLRYPNADYASLIYDLSDLWHLLTGLLLRRATRVSWWSLQLMVRISGLWFEVGAWWGGPARFSVWEIPPGPT